jgi:hypothetical protein
VFTTGTTTSGNSGSLTLGSGTATKGHGGAISITVGQGKTNAGGDIAVEAGTSAGTATGNNGGALTLKAGSQTGNKNGGSVTIQAGNSASATKGSVLVKDGAGTTVVTADDTTFTVSANAVDITSAAALGLTSTSTMTLQAGGDGVTVNAALKVSGSNVATFEGGAYFGQTNGDSAFDSTDTWARGKVARVYKITKSGLLDKSSTNLAAAGEEVVEVTVTSVQLGDLVFVTPGATNAQAVRLQWVAWCEAQKVRILFSNPATQPYSANIDWTIIVVQIR